MKTARRCREAALLPWLLLLVLGAACTPAGPQGSIPTVKVFVTSAAFPWLEAFYTCAQTSTGVRLSDPESADVNVRLGEPPDLTSPAFQIGEAEIVVVVNPENGVGALTLPQVQRVFAGEFTNWTGLGGSDVPVQVWTYSADEDVQAYFNHLVMQGRPISSLARLAVSAQDMSDGVGAAPGAIGFLPRRWKAGNTREALQLPAIPVLAITRSEPTGATKQLLACVQSGSGGSR